MFVASCQICGNVKCETSPPKAPLIPLAIPEAPMQFISVDIATLPEDDDGYKYIFLIGLYFQSTLKQCHYVISLPQRHLTLS